MLRLPLVQKLRSLGTGSDTGGLDYEVEDDVEEDKDEDDADEEDHHEGDFARSIHSPNRLLTHSLAHLPIIQFVRYMRNRVKMSCQQQALGNEYSKWRLIFQSNTNQKIFPFLA